MIFSTSSEIGDAQAGMPGDEVQHAMMGPAEAEILQDRIWVAGEIAIGEEQQFGVGQELRIGAARGLCRRGGSGAALRLQGLRQRVIYVSHVDLIFGLR